MKNTVNWTWNGEKIVIDFVHPPIPIRGFDFLATLDNYDPTPWDFETPARGPHATTGWGKSPEQAATDLIQVLWENYS